MENYLIGVILSLYLMLLGIVNSPEILTKHKKNAIYVGTAILALLSWGFIAYAVYRTITGGKK